MDAPLALRPTTLDFTPATNIHIHLLGTFHVTTGRGLISDGFWHGGRARTLFKYLAYHAGTAVDKDNLIADLWPDGDADAAQNNLHKAVHLLRQTLTLALGVNGKEMLEFSQGSYTLNGADLRIDALEFKSAIFDGKWATRTGDLYEAAAHFQRAIGIYTGDLLEDDYATTWAITERIRLQNDYAYALTWLAERHRAIGRRADGVSFARLLLSMFPTHEGMYRYLIEDALLDGRRGEAMRLYRSLQDACAHAELGDPSPSLTAMVDAGCAPSAVYERAAG